MREVRTTWGSIDVSLKDALLLDADGAPTKRHLVLESRDWDEIRTNTDQVYMPFRVCGSSTGTPWSTNYTASVGPFVLSRFRYGAHVDLEDFEPASGRGIVLTQVAGRVRHQGDVVTDAGESFAVDVSRCRYWLSAEPEHDQLNLTFRHQDLADLHVRWFGSSAPPRLWELAFQFGGPGASWLTLLDYAARGIAELPDEMESGALGPRVAEMIGVHLLTEWRRHCGEVAGPSAAPAPRYVVKAESFMREHASAAPTLTEVADAVGVSVRALTLAFRRYRDQSPIAFLRDLRMEGVRADLLAADPGSTVSSVIAGWGYVNHGVFARSYEQRFGELPSATLGRASTLG
ncbi:AraC family transcriptional regulator [Nocardioides daejeonensis]|uniref:AraC family transcriptional regulator n=1 Tax=Nocardioides daejeonensis TaxID=1046556 RepID=UPI000D74B659|nr:AraC family transcriptional regulator [Nocardioides daejeonensis]